jgi:hypothetical protein
LALDEGEWSDSYPDNFIPKERIPDTKWRGGVDPRTRLDAKEKEKISISPKNQTQFTGHPAGSLLLIFTELS